MEELGRIRVDFVQRVSRPTINGLLDELWQVRVLNTEDKDYVIEGKHTDVDRARGLIDMVIRKGERASGKMIGFLKERDPELYNSLLGASLAVVDGPALPAQGMVRSLELIPCSARFKKDKLNDKYNIYPVKARADGTRLALLITNVSFKHLTVRDGADKDEENMEKLLSSLGYNVVKHRDLSGKEMDEAMKKFSEECGRLRTTDSVFVVIMSHGRIGYILGVHHKEGQPDEYPIENIYKCLKSDRCRGLLDKPKVILIQACRGEKDGSELVQDGPGSVQKQASDLQTDDPLPPHLANPEEEDIEVDGFRRVHSEKDMISLLSCTADTVSYRHARNGSIFIQYIVDIFNNHAHDTHIEELFRHVMQRFEAEHPSASKRQMPVKDRCTLNKHFYLFPGQ